MLGPAAADRALHAIVLVTLERESSEHHEAFDRRMRGTPEVQQCYSVAGEWDYVVVLVARDMPHCRRLGDRLFKNDANIRRYDTMPVFDRVKTGLAVPSAACLEDA